MSQDEFTKLFKYMQGEFNKLYGGFDGISTKFDKLEGAIDSYANQTEIYM